MASSQLLGCFSSETAVECLRDLFRASHGEADAACEESRPLLLRQEQDLLFSSSLTSEDISVFSFHYTQFGGAVDDQLVNRALELIAGEISRIQKPELLPEELNQTFSSVSLVLSCLCTLLARSMFTRTPNQRYEIVDKVKLALEPLWTVGELTKHLDETWLGEGLVVFLFAALAVEPMDREAGAHVEPLIRKMSDLVPVCIETNGTATTGLKMLWLVFLFTLNPIFSATTTSLNGVLESLKRLHKSVRADIMDAAVWIEVSCYMKGRTNKNQFRGIRAKAYVEPTSKELMETVTQPSSERRLHMLNGLMKAKIPEISKRFSELEPQPFFRLFWTSCVSGEAKMVRAMLLLHPTLAGTIAATSDPKDYDCLAIHKCVRRERALPALKTLLELGHVNIAAGRRGGATALHLAASRNCLSIVKELIAQGADPEQKDSQRKSSLYWACSVGAVDCINYIITLPGVDVNNADEDGFSILHRTAIVNNVTFLKELLARGAKIDATTRGGRTPLHRAIAKSCVDTSIALCELGASVIKTDVRGDTPLHMAVTADLPAVVTYLIEQKKVPVNARNRSHGWTPLHMAGSEQVAKILLAANADVEVESIRKEKPIHVAACAGVLGVVKALLDHYDCANSETKRMNSLCAAALSGSVEIVKLLIERGARVNAALDDGTTPLFMACTHEHHQVVRALLEAGADPNAARKGDIRPIHVASTVYNAAECLRVLIEYKAEVNLQDSPLLRALAVDCREQALTLIQAGANCWTQQDNEYAQPIVMAAERGFDDVVEAILAVHKERGLTLSEEDGLFSMAAALSNRSYKCGKALMPWVEIIPGDYGMDLELMLKLLREFPTQIKSVSIQVPEIRDQDFGSMSDSDSEDEQATESELGVFKLRLKALLEVAADVVALNQPQLGAVAFTNLLAEVPTALEIEPAVLRKIEAALETNYSLFNFGFINPDDDTVSVEISLTELLQDQSYLISNYLFRNKCLRDVPYNSMVFSMAALWREGAASGDFVLGHATNEKQQVRLHSFIVKCRAPKLFDNPAIITEKGISLLALKLLRLHLYTGLGPFRFLLPKLTAAEFDLSQVDHFDIAVDELQELAEELGIAPPLVTLTTHQNGNLFRSTSNDDQVFNETRQSLQRLSSDLQSLFAAVTSATPAPAPLQGDFAISASDEDHKTVFVCHRTFLARRWPWFTRMVESGLKEAAEGKLDFTPTQHDLGISADFLQLLLQYFYTGELSQFDHIDLALPEEDGAHAAHPTLKNFYEHIADYFGFEDTPQIALQHKELLQLFARLAKSS